MQPLRLCLFCILKIRNPYIETRNKFIRQKFKCLKQVVFDFCHYDLDIVSDFGFRASDFYR